jgi:hypothetical protein
MPQEASAVSVAKLILLFDALVWRQARGRKEMHGVESRGDLMDLIAAFLVALLDSLASLVLSLRRATMGKMVAMGRPRGASEPTVRLAVSQGSRRMMTMLIGWTLGMLLRGWRRRHFRGPGVVNSLPAYPVFCRNHGVPVEYTSFNTFVIICQQVSAGLAHLKC